MRYITLMLMLAVAPTAIKADAIDSTPFQPW